MREEKKDGKWYQTSLREMLLVTTLAAVLLSYWRTFGFGGVLNDLTMVAIILLPLVDAYFLFRRACRDAGLEDRRKRTKEGNADRQ